MQVSQKLVDEFKDIAEKKGHKFKNDAEARESAQRFASLMELLFEIAQKDVRRKKKLKDKPRGFPIDEEGYFSCLICHTTISSENGWYDKYGFKCLDCQRAVNKKALPVKAQKDRDSWFADWQIQHEFNIHPSTRRKLQRKGLLKGVDLKREDGVVYFTLYLLKDNQEFIKKYPKEPKLRMTGFWPR